MYKYEQLITDDIFLKIMNDQQKKGIFDIVGQTHTEHWHSSFICWLLAPDSNHGLDSFPVDRFISLYISKLSEEQNKECEKIEYSEVLDYDSSSLKFRTEQGIYGKAQGQIDILGVNEDYAIIIENKVDAQERYVSFDEGLKGQTFIYYDYFSNKEKYKNVKKLYVYLTASDTSPYDSHFMKITYQEFYDNVILKCINHPKIKQEAKYLIEQYVCNLRKKSSKTNKALALPAKTESKLLYDKYEHLFISVFDNAKKNSNVDVNSLEFKLYTKYQSVFDEIFLSVKGIAPSINLQSKELVKYLVLTGKIKVGDEFYHKGQSCVFETDLLEDNGEYYFIVGVKDEWAIRDEQGNLVRYEHFKAAAQAIQNKWNEINNKNASKASIDGTTWWHLNSIDGQTPKDLQ